MKGKIIGGVAAMTMALATFVSFGITASATDYSAKALYNNYANNKPNVLQNGDRIQQDGGTTAWTWKSILFLTHKYANGNTYKAEFKTDDGSYATVGSGNSRYRYWKVTYSKKERIQHVRDDYYITLTANDPSYNAPTAKSLTYNGQEQVLANAASSVSGGTVKYSTNNSSWGTAVPKETAAGTYTVYYKVDGSTNYNSIPSTSFKVTINKAASTLTAAPAAKELTWTGEAQELVNAGTATGGTVQYKLDGGSYSTAIPTAADAGTYTVYYKVAGDANHNDIAEKSVTVTISKADAELTATPAAKENLTWTGEAQALVNAGAATGGEVQYSLDNSNWSADIPTAADAGDYTVYYKVAGDANHNDIAENSVNVTISKANAELTTEPTAKELTWTGEAQALVTAGAATFGTVQYKLGDGSYSTAVPTATDAGTYTVYYKVDGTDNYNGIAENSVNVTISKANAVLTTEPTAKELTWTGEAQELVTAGAANGGTIQYKLGDGSYSTAVPTAKDAGTYTVYYKVVGDANHNDIAENNVTATIGAKAAEATYKEVMDFGGEDYEGEASAWTVTVTPGSTAITSVDVKVNGKSSDGAWNNNTAISGGPINFGVVVKAAADKVNSMTAVVNGVDVPATPDTAPID